ncbi:hypothetical protein M378DRAFT_162814 [Amanita muscaria Koide BX008]|uniref:Uncharacterized protein n=1 Tax=Amanita muscaria (strain Koide BX008) TaxID=946122 RepID=A0A0C2X5Z3_AMAMK|nr:hypothetical protein M378DRAFT_162814 [Amanita muscaria Koide BX008]
MGALHRVSDTPGTAYLVTNQSYYPCNVSKSNSSPVAVTTLQLNGAHSKSPACVTTILP